MEVSKARPCTPPPIFGLMTPPSTGGFVKQALFARPQEVLCDSNRRQTKVGEGETPTEFFEGGIEGPNIEIEDVDCDCDSNDSLARADSAPQPSDGESSTASTILSTGTGIPESSTFEKPNLLTSSIKNTDTCVITSPFPFMKLPISIRNRICKHLLVIPALICVRQKHTSFHDEKKAFLYAERRSLLPGIAYALAQVKVDGFKTRFSKFPGINLNILRTSREIFAEARAVMYSMNSFEIVKPTNELTPQPDFSIPLFPTGYQRLVAKLNIRIRTFYDLDWLLSGGYNILKNYYRGLRTLTLILEMDSATKGFGREWARKKDEKWTTFIKRLQDQLAGDLFNSAKSKNPTKIPTSIDLRILFSGDAYEGNPCTSADDVGGAVTLNVRNEQVKRSELGSALVETWELFKKGGK
ncbi:hypothetical protein EKO04_003587 [Ascochyta lentis]|uniref:Uncharacterized protein n=1 Tax=Ascochyta lentis TaxID=205686 RepID=A0A8H7J7Z2_9PLEO|nr:hypothetical protein EKO04_003587 [Ascochyta lentis]